MSLSYQKVTFSSLGREVCQVLGHRVCCMVQYTCTYVGLARARSVRQTELVEQCVCVVKAARVFSENDM